MHRHKWLFRQWKTQPRLLPSLQVSAPSCFLVEVAYDITAAIQQRLKRCPALTIHPEQSHNSFCSSIGPSKLYHPAPPGKHLI